MKNCFKDNGQCGIEDQWFELDFVDEYAWLRRAIDGALTNNNYHDRREQNDTFLKELTKAEEQLLELEQQTSRPQSSHSI